MSLQQPASAWQLEDGSVVVAPELTVDLPGGLTGHYQRDFYDCLRASVATCLGWSYEETDVPDQREGESESGPLLAFAARHRLRVSAHSPDEAPDHPWVAFSPRFPAWPLPGPDLVHIFVAKGSEVFFDPWNFRRPDGSPYPDQSVTEIAYGFSLHPEKGLT
jgi:hypothetical protein